MQFRQQGTLWGLRKAKSLEDLEKLKEGLEDFVNDRAITAPAISEPLSS